MARRPRQPIDNDLPPVVMPAEPGMPGAPIPPRPGDPPRPPRAAPVVYDVAPVTPPATPVEPPAAPPPRPPRPPAQPPRPPGGGGYGNNLVFTRDPAPEVLSYFRNKGYSLGFDWRDVWPQEHAHAFTVAKAMEMDVLRAIRAEVDRAIALGLPFEQFQAALTPRLQQLGWWGRKEVTDPVTGLPTMAQLGSPHRLRIIYDANIRSANAAGTWQRIQRSKDIMPFLIYQRTSSAEPREEHLEWADQPVVLPVDDPWWDTHFPPNGWQCKCWVLQADDEDAKAAGWTPDTQAPDLDLEPWLNRRTGDTQMVPKGIDAGWHNNPGKTRASLLDALLNDNLDGADPAIRATALKDLTSSPLYKAITEGRITSRPTMPDTTGIVHGNTPRLADVAVPTGHLPRAIQEAQGWRSGVVWIESTTAGAIRNSAKPFGWAKSPRPSGVVDWTLLPRVIDEGVLVRHKLDGGWLTAYRQIDGLWYRVELAQVDRTIGGGLLQQGPRLEVKSFTEINTATAEAELKAAGKDARVLRTEDGTVTAPKSGRRQLPKPVPDAVPEPPLPIPPSGSERAPRQLVRRPAVPARPAPSEAPPPPPKPATPEAEFLDRKVREMVAADAADKPKMPLFGTWHGGPPPKQDRVVPVGELPAPVAKLQGLKKRTVFIDPQVANYIIDGSGGARIDWTELGKVIDGGKVVRHAITPQWLTIYREIDGVLHRVEVMVRDMRPDGEMIKGRARLRIESWQRASATDKRALLLMQAEMAEAAETGRLLAAGSQAKGSNRKTVRKARKRTAKTAG